MSRNFPTRSPTPSNAHKNGQEKVDVEKVKNKMKKIWKTKEDCSSTSQDEITSSNGLGDHTTGNQGMYENVI